jgi:hypothetical protein
MSRFFPLLHGCQIAPAPFIKKSIIPPLHCFCTLVKNQLDLFVWIHFWVLYSIPLIDMFTSMLIPHHLGYTAWNWIDWFLPFFSPFARWFLAMLVTLSFQINFRISLSIFTKYLEFWWNSIESMYQRGENSHPYCVGSSCPWTQ